MEGGLYPSCLGGSVRGAGSAAYGENGLSEGNGVAGLEEGAADGLAVDVEQIASVGALDPDAPALGVEPAMRPIDARIVYNNITAVPFPQNDRIVAEFPMHPFLATALRMKYPRHDSYSSPTPPLLPHRF